MSVLKGSHECATAHAAAARVVTLATALKQTTIYPESHPRVVSGIETFLTPLRECGTTCTMLLRGDTFLVDGTRVSADQGATAWLAERLRENGLRGIEMTPFCTVAEMLQLAEILRRSRRMEKGAVIAPELSTVNVRALPLVFTGHHSDVGAPADADDADWVDPANELPASVGDALRQIRDSAAYRDQLADLDRAATTAGEAGYRELDLLTTIGKVLPAEVANEPERIPEIVKRILDTIQAELQGVVSGNRKVRGGRLVLRALEIARSFFGSEPPAKPTERTLPSGRPEDARFAADLPALLREQATLPVEDRPLAELITDAIGPKLGHELLGVCLHTFAKTPSHTALMPRLTQLLRQHADERADLVDAYLKGREAEAMPPARRLRLIEALAEAGHAGLVRERGYIDQELVTRNFPESLRVVTKVFGGDAAGPAQLRAMLQTLARTLAVGGVETARRCGVLLEPGVLPALLAAGGPEAGALALAAADADPRGTRQPLVDHLRRQTLPEPASLVLRIHTSAETLPASYVRSLLTCFFQGRYDQAVRTATGELLREALASDRPLALPERLAAIDNLHLVPDPQTEQLLVGLARQGRFLKWGREARALRQRARKMLAEIRTNIPR